MLAAIRSAAVLGIDAYDVCVEVGGARQFRLLRSCSARDGQSLTRRPTKSWNGVRPPDRDRAPRRAWWTPGRVRGRTRLLGRVGPRRRDSAGARGAFSRATSRLRDRAPRVGDSIV